MRISDLSKEPEGVAGVKMMSGRLGGSLGLRASGRTELTVFMG